MIKDILSPFQVFQPKIVLITILTLFVFGSCERERYLILDSDKSDFDSTQIRGFIDILNYPKAKDSLEVVLDHQDNYDFMNLTMLINKEVDVIMANNDVANNYLDNEIQNTDSAKNVSNNTGFINDEKVRTATVLYPEVLFILYRSEIEATTLKELLRDRKISFGKNIRHWISLDDSNSVFDPITPSEVEDYNSENIMNALMNHFNVKVAQAYGDYTITELDTVDIVFDIFKGTYRWFKEDSTKGPDILCLLCRPNDPFLNEMLVDATFSIFSFDDIDTPPQASRVGGFTTYNPVYYPFVIPKENFGSVPIKPITTIAVDRLLLTRSDVSTDFIFRFMSVVIGKEVPIDNENANTINFVNKLFQLRIDNDKDNLNYRLHKGTEKFYKYQKDERTFIERYGRTLASIATAILALVGAIVRWRGNQRYKRLKQYYELAIDIEKELSDHWQDPKFLEESLDKLLKIKEEVYDLLSSGKLQININFTAFQDMLGTLILEIAMARQSAILLEYTGQEIPLDTEETEQKSD